MKKQITYVLLLVSAVVATQSTNADNRYGKNGAGQRQVAPQVDSQGNGMYNLKPGGVDGEMSTMPVNGNPRRGDMSTMPVSGNARRGDMSTMPVNGNPRRTSSGEMGAMPFNGQYQQGGVEGYGNGEMSANKNQYRYKR